MKIKYRVWDKQRKEFLSSLWHIVIDTDGTLILLGSNNWEYCEEQDRYIILMYTEANDKNGKEIYDHDILKFNHKQYGNMVGVVEFIAGMFMVSDDGEHDYEIGYLPFKDFEILGNIYENPELIPKEWSPTER